MANTGRDELSGLGPEKGNQTVTHKSQSWRQAPGQPLNWGVSCWLDTAGLGFLTCKIETARHH